MDLEQIKAELNRAGWFVSLQDNGSQWTCELLKGPCADWPANYPRPRSTGATALEAVEDAVRLRDWLVAERKRGAA